jgi:hypothetical protein
LLVLVVLVVHAPLLQTLDVDIDVEVEDDDGA